jgi:RNA polymerase sigma factor (sigma-70 family)
VTFVSKPPAIVVAMDARLLTKLHTAAQASKWAISEAAFRSVLERSAAKSLAAGAAAADRVERYLTALHLEDLALAAACESGHDAAWDHFVLQFRPVLYRAADALAPGGGAREIADAIYADLFGIQEREGERRSLFRYYHGRSSHATWLRAVLAQRHVDAIRASRRLTPIEDEAPAIEARPARASADPERPRWLAAVKLALQRAIGALPDRDRLRLGCYYREDLTLAQIGRLLGEHEATVSRHLTRIRGAIRAEVERVLQSEHSMTAAEIAQCFESTIDDPGGLDVRELLGSTPGRKNSEPERSI